MGVDLSVIVTAHDETLVSGPTMAAADLAIREAEAAGFTVERVIALDNATPETTAYFNQPAFDAWTRKVMTCGDLGEVRNALVPQVAGEAIAFLDADDLFSSNWLARGMKRLRAAEAAGERVIVHPELNWLFDGARSVFWKPAQDDPLFLPEYLYFMNYYDSLCLAPREAHLRVPYVSRDIPNGLSFQDWQFSIESIAAGWMHVSASDTIIFKRRRDESLVTESRARKALVRPLAPMRIDRIADLGRPTSKTSRPPAGVNPRAATRRSSGTAPDASGAVGDGVRRLWRRIFGRDRALPTAPTTITARIEMPASAAQQVPHFGKVFADRIAYAAQRAGHGKHAKMAGTPAYKAISPAFDLAYYLACHPDMARALKMDPVGHYLRAGAREGRDPSPLFSTKHYLARYPDVADSKENPFAHYLMRGRAEGRIAPPVPRFETIAAALGMSPAEAEAVYGARYNDLRERLERGELGRQALRAAEIEPLISLGWPEALQVKIPPFHTDLVAQRLGIFLDLLASAERRPARFLILVNRARFGGALRLEGQVAQALASGCAPDEIVIAVTDHAGLLPSERVPEGVRQIDFAAAVADLRVSQHERMLAEFIRALAPECVFNVNSRLLWQTLTIYGDALAHGTKIIGALFCGEQSIYGHWTGYPYKRAYRHFHQLHGLVTDSHALAAELRQQYAIPPHLSDRIVTLDAPVDTSIPLVPQRETPNARPQVYWSGRFDRQKRIDLVFDIAAAMPEADFHLWGTTVMDGAPPEPRSANVTLHPPYARFADLPLENADLWLYTSGWDGVPQTLLEAGLTGLPLVASDVGGTREAALPGMATLIGAQEPLETWVAEIRALLADPGPARDRAQDLRAALLKARTREAYAKQVWGLVGASSDTLPSTESAIAGN